MTILEELASVGSRIRSLAVEEIAPELAAINKPSSRETKFTPMPGLVLKTQATNADVEKVFINLGQSDLVPAPVVNSAIVDRSSYRVSLSIAGVGLDIMRRDVDKLGRACGVVDVCANPQVLAQVKRLDLVELRQSEALESLLQFVEQRLSHGGLNVLLSRDSVTVPNILSKGQLREHTIYARNESAKNESLEEVHNVLAAPQSDEIKLRPDDGADLFTAVSTRRFEKTDQSKKNGKRNQRIADNCKKNPSSVDIQHTSTSITLKLHLPADDAIKDSSLTVTETLKKGPEIKFESSVCSYSYIIPRGTVLVKEKAEFSASARTLTLALEVIKPKK